MSRKVFKVAKCPDSALAVQNRIIINEKQGLFSQFS